MRTVTLPLDESESATFTASGVAVVRIGPRHLAHVWIPRNAAVTTSVGGDDTAQARLYLGGSTGAGALIGGTFTGGQDSTELWGFELKRGGLLTCEWTGGTPGAVATLSVAGELKITGR